MTQHLRRSSRNREKRNPWKSYSIKLNFPEWECKQWVLSDETKGIVEALEVTLWGSRAGRGVK